MTAYLAEVWDIVHPLMVFFGVIIVFALVFKVLEWLD